MAEDGSFDKDPESVKDLYDDAIKTSTRSGLLHLAAMASERGGQYFMAINDVSRASFYFSGSLDWYTDWGASGKVTQMITHYGKLLARPSSPHATVCLKARKRYSEEDSSRLKKFNLDSGDTL